MTNTRQQIVSYLQMLEGEQVKALVLDWLAETEGTLSDFERLLAVEQPTIDANVLEHGELSEALAFQSLTQTEMVAKSLDALNDYSRTGKSISHDRVRKWLDSFGTDHPMPCPK